MGQMIDRAPNCRRTARQRGARRLAEYGLLVGLGGAIVLASCSDDTGGSTNGAPGGTAGIGASDAGAPGNAAGGSAGVVNAEGLVITPDEETLSVDPQDTLPTIQYRVTDDGQPVDAEWSVDRTDLARISADGVLTPTGRAAGTVTVTAIVAGETLTATLLISIETVQNGPTTGPGGAVIGPDPDAPPGPGGYLGVGGEGIGEAVADDVETVLASTPELDPAMKLLYPYDGTVWPQGMLPPLLMWDASEAAEAEGISIKLTAANFDFTGYYGRPARLADDSPFVRHPIPLGAWQAATASAAGGELSLEVVVARGGVAYGPMKATWQIAGGMLQGCIYYQSYFTNLVDNENGALGPDPRFGGATLGIRPGATDPVLVAGRTSEGMDACPVCHTVSADGTRMVVQHGDDYQASSSIDLKNGYAETPYSADTNSALGWVGMTPDGALGLGNSMPLVGGANDTNASTTPIALYDLETGAEVEANGLADFVLGAGLPAFSYQGDKVAFNFWEGPGNADIGPGDGKKLVAMDFDRASLTFSNPSLLYSGELPSMWPSFLPDDHGVVFQVELENGSGDHPIGNTRAGGRGELWWSDLATGTAVRLDTLNGLRDGELYVPTSDTHPNDNELNYEPTVSPLASGGYAWVVFMSRRLYGNEITAEPWASDPRTSDLTVDYSPKKLWVAAIKLDAEPGTDPSYPAFYLPAQEIQASNSRGYWTADPCVYVGQM